MQWESTSVALSAGYRDQDSQDTAIYSIFYCQGDDCSWYWSSEREYIWKKTPNVANIHLLLHNVHGKLFIARRELAYKNISLCVCVQTILCVFLYPEWKWQGRGTCDQGALLSCCVQEQQHAARAKSLPGFEQHPKGFPHQNHWWWQSLFLSRAVSPGESPEKQHHCESIR